MQTIIKKRGKISPKSIPLEKTYLIQPWGAAEDDSIPLPTEVVHLAKQALKRYDLEAYDMTLITSKPDKGGAIWKVRTNKGLYAIKLLHRIPPRSLFSVAAQDYLVNKGARVPPLVPNKKGKLYVELGGKVWIVSKWIDTLAQAEKMNLTSAQQLSYGLGEFHKLSVGYLAPKGAEKKTRVARWPDYYQKVYRKLDWFRKIATAYHDAPASPTLLSVIDTYQRKVNKSLGQLLQSPYPRVITRGDENWGLAHQDYGWSNGQLGPGGVWIIDLDGVAYDIPIRDLSKLITSTMNDLGVWDPNWIRVMIDAYHQANPIEPEVFQILLVDLAFPNTFYKELKEMVYDPAAFLNQETNEVIKRIVRIDKTKRLALKAIRNWRER